MILHSFFHPPFPTRCYLVEPAPKAGLGKATALEAGTHGSPCPPPRCFPLPPRASGSWQCKEKLIWLLNSRRAKGHEVLEPASLRCVHRPSPPVLFFLWGQWQTAAGLSLATTVGTQNMLSDLYGRGVAPKPF